MTVKSQDDCPKCREHRSNEVLTSTIDELAKVKKERDDYYMALMQISYQTSAFGGDKEDMETALLDIEDICNWTLRPEEMKKIYEELDK